jgi:thioesterase domain-containing protein/NADP-dependent 3-hydroxy acid dehydrogenase YdfG/acyl carrier protein
VPGTGTVFGTETGGAADATGIPAPERLPEERWLHQPHWVRFRRAATDPPAAAPAPRPLILVTDDPAGPAQARALRAVRPEVVLVTPGETFARLDDHSYRVDPADPDSLGALLDALGEPGAVDWLHALPLGRAAGPVDDERLRRARWACLDTPAALVRAAAGRTGIAPRPVWLSCRARPVDGPVDRPELALLAGVTEVAPQEGAAAGLWVDLPAADPADPADPAALVSLASLLTTGEDLPRHLALRRGYWWRQDTAPVAAPAAGTGLPAGADTVHLVLGGTGGIGATVAHWLLEHTAGRVLLLARRTGLPDLPEQLAALADRIDLVTADLTAATPDRIAALVAARTRRLDTVVHAAGEGAGALITRRDPTAAHAGSLTRLNGALLVERLVERFRPRTVLYCSSMAGTLGGVGQYDYAASAGVLDAFAHHEPDGGGDTVRLSVAWDVWREVGMALRVPSADARHRAHLAVGLTVPEGRRTLERALSAGLPQVLVSTTDLQASRAFYAGPAPAPAATAPATPAADTATPGEAAGLVGGWLREWLGLDTLAPDAPLYDLGADSLTLLELIDRIKRHFDVELDLAELSPEVTLTEVLTLLERSAPPAPPVTGTPSATGALLAPAAPSLTPAAGAEEEDVPLDVWRQGTGNEVLCLVHPVGGDIQAYRALVSGLDPRLTVALIADPELRRPRGGPEWTLAERARRYHAALEVRFPAARWRRQLAGWSFGAWVAVGMAAEAEAAGRPADALHLLDPPPPGSGPLHQGYGEEELQALFAHELGLGGDRAGEAAREYAERLTRRCLANLRSMADHRLPALTTTPARVWLARQPVQGLPPLGPPARQRPLWSTVLTAPTHWEEVETTHYGLVRPPHVAAVTDAVNAAVH